MTYQSSQYYNPEQAPGNFAELTVRRRNNIIHLAAANLERVTPAEVQKPEVEVVRVPTEVEAEVERLRNQRIISDSERDVEAKRWQVEQVYNEAA